MMQSQAMARLAAAHRGAVRTLQGFVAHLADPLKQQPASAHCRELGHIIRQLSLCSTRLEANSAVPDVVADLLLQIEVWCAKFHWWLLWVMVKRFSESPVAGVDLPLTGLVVVLPTQF